MKKNCIVILLTFFALTGCSTYQQGKKIILETESAATFDTQNETAVISDLHAQKWQDAYADLLRESLGNNFYFCDIDNNGIPELLIDSSSSDTEKHAVYSVYTYKSNLVECLGTIGTLRWSNLWLDNNGGILGYSYGAGGGGTYRYYIDNGVLCYDGEVWGYYYDSEGNNFKWFRGSDESRVIVTEDNKEEYERIWKSVIDLERYIATEDTILTVIYGKS